MTETIYVLLLGLMSGALTSGAMLPQAYRIYKTKQTRDISFLFITSLWIGTAGWVIYGWYTNSLAVILCNGFSIFLVGYVWCAKYDEQPVKSYHLLSEFFDQKTTNTDKRG
jgi:MtN3 and saliva related transmembrane protein